MELLGLKETLQFPPVDVVVVALVDVVVVALVDVVVVVALVDVVVVALVDVVVVALVDVVVVALVDVVVVPVPPDWQLLQYLFRSPSFCESCPFHVPQPPVLL